MTEDGLQDKVTSPKAGATYANVSGTALLACGFDDHCLFLTPRICFHQVIPNLVSE